MSTKRSSKALAAVFVGAALLAACGDADTPAATAPTSSSSPSSSSPTPEVTEPTADPAATQALPLLAEREGAQTSALAPAVGTDSPDTAVLASTTDEISTTITFWAWDGTQFQPDGSVVADEPLLVDREGGASEWRYLTANLYPDAVVYLRGGSMSGFVDAVIARRDGPGQWRLVPFEGENPGIEPGQAVYASNPLFDDSRTFVTRAQAGGQVVVTYWRYDDLDGANSFAVSPEPDPTATQG